MRSQRMPWTPTSRFPSGEANCCSSKEGFDWTTRLAAFPRKVLFLRGDLNQAATLEHQQELAASYPNASIETIAGVGHHMIWERTEEYLTHVRAYLAEIGAGR